VLVRLRPAQEIEFHETGHGSDLRVAAAPDGLEIGLASAVHLKSIHGNEHHISLLAGPRAVARGHR
jgi:hypothetical protein